MQARVIDGETWLARTAIDAVGASYRWRVAITARGDRGWQIIDERDPPRPVEIMGMGPWPGGAVITVEKVGAEPGPATVKVVAGTASAPLPQLPPIVARNSAFATTPSGEAFGTWDDEPPRRAVRLFHWRRGTVDPDVIEVPNARRYAFCCGSPFLIRSPEEVYFAIAAPTSSPHVAQILRFDGDAWRTSFILPPGSGVTGATLTPDGAVWVVATRDPARKTRDPIIWRRRPGAADQWDPIAGDEIHASSSILPKQIMPAGARDVLVSAELAGTGLGIYRIRLEDR